MPEPLQQAIFAAGCFWGVQAYFDQIPGVVSSRTGYTGGTTDDPTYAEVCAGNTGHAEAVLLEFDPQIVSYETLVKHFVRLHNPTELNRQGPDIGDQYRSEIFYMSDEQKGIAETVMAEAQNDYKQPIVTRLEHVNAFYDAEAEHQKHVAG